MTHVHSIYCSQLVLQFNKGQLDIYVSVIVESLERCLDELVSCMRVDIKFILPDEEWTHEMCSSSVILLSRYVALRYVQNVHMYSLLSCALPPINFTMYAPCYGLHTWLLAHSTSSQVSLLFNYRESSWSINTITVPHIEA